MSVPPPSSAPAMPAAPPRLATPDITPAQIVAAVGGAIGLAVALGAPLSQQHQQLLTLFVTVFAPVLVAADAAIRHSRAKYVHTATEVTLRALASLTPEKDTEIAELAQVIEGHAAETNGHVPADTSPAISPSARPAVPAGLEIG